jgi:hypothetical protein
VGGAKAVLDRLVHGLGEAAELANVEIDPARGVLVATLRDQDDLALQNPGVADDGAARLDGGLGQLRDVKLGGDQISFTVLDADGARRDFSGRVSGNTMQGVVKQPGGETKWSATRAN